jgi:hypothetical protein
MPQISPGPLGASTTTRRSDAAIRYEERELAIVRWCKKPVGSMAQPVEPRDEIAEESIPPPVE